VKKLNPPQLDAETVYISIKDRSKSQDKKDILKRWRDYVKERYQEYEAKKQNLESITSSQITIDKHKDAFTSCYSRNSKGYLEGEVVANIIAIQSIQHKQKCPYCGMDKPRTIDHYLPKSMFPEFSVFPPNLLPCCGYCNNKKRDDWLEDGKRIYLNLYFDDIPEDKQFLFAHLEYEQNSIVPFVSFSIENRNNIEQGLFNLITSHYENLNLLQEFSENVEESLSCILDDIQHNPELSIEEHKTNLLRRYKTNVRKYGINYWESAFLKTIIESEKFLKICSKPYKK
jgi:5-methylcytosine-specific restriction endonuclease McrA